MTVRNHHVTPQGALSSSLPSLSSPDPFQALGFTAHCSPVFPAFLGSFRGFSPPWIRQDPSCLPHSLGLSHFLCIQSSSGMRYYFRRFHSKYFIYFNACETKKKTHKQHMKQTLLFRLLISFLNKLFSKKGLQFKQIK